MAVAQKINRAALDIFIMLVFFLRASVTNLFLHKPQLTLCGSVPVYCAGAREKGKQNLWPNGETFDLSVISDRFFSSGARYGLGAGVGRGLGVSVGRGVGP